MPHQCQRLCAVAVVLVLSACAALPPGVPKAPRDDPAAGTLTLPGGRAVSVYPDALRYTGEARFEWPNGRIYDGAWVEGQPEGQGTDIQPHGHVYQGGWQDGKRHGQGELLYPDGSRYEGSFAAGQRHGSGTMTSPGGTYSGDWAHGNPHGSGTFTGRDGTRYEGHWRQGQRSGHGTHVHADGSRYQGEWADDRPHGFGRMENSDGASYEGEWRDGSQHGYGRAEESPGLIYEGTWAHGKRHGFGRETRPDGSVYEGDWEAGKRQGQGREDRPDGAFHDGTWEYNQALGPGRRRASSGIEISGMWNDDTVSTGLLTLPTGLEYAGPLFGQRNTRASQRLQTWLHAAAERGDPYAQLLLGTLYLDFDEPAPDLEQGRQWLGRAATAGIAEAQFRLALTYEGNNPPRMVEWLSEAAQQQHAEANLLLGELYEAGNVVPRSLDRAIHYFERAVAGGSIAARNDLAWLLATADEPEVRDGRRAVNVIRPIALYTGAWHYLDTLAAAWAAAGRFDEAVATARTAIDNARRELRDNGLRSDVPDVLAPLERRLAAYRNGEAHVEPPP